MIIELLSTLIVFSGIISPSHSKFYQYNSNTQYNPIEHVHSCVENDYETCNKEHINKILLDVNEVETYSDLLHNLKNHYSDRDYCLDTTSKNQNECFEQIFIKLLIIINNNSNLNDTRKTINQGTIHKDMDRCVRNEKICRTSTFVIDNMRSCTNEAVENFYREAYKNVESVETTDVNSALVKLQQKTVENRDKLVTGIKFIHHLDLMMNRLSFCSEMINTNDAVGI